MAKTLLNPKYALLKPFTDDIEARFAQGRSLREKRNTIRVCTYAGLELNVKRYHRPGLLRALIYTFLRQPKGLRAYRHARLIAQAGVETPEEVAYIERRRHGLIADTYFVCLQSPYKRRFYEFAEAPLTPENTRIITEFARMTARLHEARLMHLDYSPGNILFDLMPDGRYHFALIDTNRLRTGPVSPARGCANFARLWGQPELFDLIADTYARARGLDPARCRTLVRAARKKFWTRYDRRHGAPFPLRF